MLSYGDYRKFEAVIEKAKLACFNSGHRIEDHFVDVTEMIEIGKGGQRPVKTILMSRYACWPGNLNRRYQEREVDSKKK